MADESRRRSWVEAARTRSRRFLEWAFEADTLRAVPAWGISVLVHGLVCLVLGLIFDVAWKARHDRAIEPASLETGIGDGSSLLNALAAGELPSEAGESEPQVLGVSESIGAMRLGIQPLGAAALSYARSVTLPSLGIAKRDLGRRLLIRPKGMAEGAGGGATRKGASAFAGRSSVNRRKMALRGGGTAESEDAVERGLAWLARHQRTDGSWGLDTREQCQGDGCGGGSNMVSDTAATGLAILPFLGAGYHHMEKTKYQDCVRRGIEWLVAHEQENGDLFVQPAGHGAYMYSQAIGTMAICEAYGMTQDARLEIPAQSAIEFIIRAQNAADGGWRYVPRQSGDTSVFGWQIFALRSGVMAKIAVPKEVLELASHYLDLAAHPTYGYAYHPPAIIGNMVMGAEALACRQILGWRREFPALVMGARQVAEDLEKTARTTRNVYYWYYATQLLKNMRNEDWKIWNVMVREALVGMQERSEGCSDGSWDPRFPVADVRGVGAGRLYETALSLLILEVYYRYPPTDGDPEMSPGLEEETRTGRFGVSTPIAK